MKFYPCTIVKKSFAEHLVDACPWMTCEVTKEGALPHRPHSQAGEAEMLVQTKFPTAEFAPASALPHRAEINEGVVKSGCIISYSKIVEHIFVWCFTAYKTHSQH